MVAPSLVWKSPIAAHASGSPHETPVNSPSGALESLGVAWIGHWVPFHCSASDLSPWYRLSYPPTAMQPAASGQETPSR